MDTNGPSATTVTQPRKKKTQSPSAEVSRKKKDTENLPMKKCKLVGDAATKVSRKKLPLKKCKQDDLLVNSDTLDTSADTTIDDEITPTVTVGRRRLSSSSSSNVRVADTMENEFLGKLVAFNCNTDYCQELIASFGNKFVLEAVCTELNT
jgi:hypothetical protein